MPWGSQLESTTATIGMPRRRASEMAMCSAVTFTTNMASGSFVISFSPSRDLLYLLTSRLSRACSFFVSSVSFSSSAWVSSMPL